MCAAQAPEVLSFLLDSLRKDTSQGHLPVLSSPVCQLPGAAWLGARQGEALVAHDGCAGRRDLRGHIGLTYVGKK